MIAAPLWLTLGFTPDTPDSPDRAGVCRQGCQGSFLVWVILESAARSVVCAALAQTTDTYDTNDSEG
jgi:hypothetical protein